MVRRTRLLPDAAGEGAAGEGRSVAPCPENGRHLSGTAENGRSPGLHRFGVSWKNWPGCGHRSPEPHRFGRAFCRGLRRRAEAAEAESRLKQLPWCRRGRRAVVRLREGERPQFWCVRDGTALPFRSGMELVSFEYHGPHRAASFRHGNLFRCRKRPGLLVGQVLPRLQRI